MRSGELLNLVGLGLGVVLYAMLLAMVLRTRRAPGLRSTLDPLLLTTAILGLLWNVLALVSDELSTIGARSSPLLTTSALVALGFLPAVVVHSVLRGESNGVRGTGRRTLAASGYAASATAALFQYAAAWQGSSVPSTISMRLLTYAFVGLVVPVAVVTRGKPGSRRVLWITALTVFAASAFHLSGLHQPHTSWPVELFGHHASLPLALAILYQDYPFALADLFAKRLLNLLSIVAVALGGVMVVARSSPAFARFLSDDPSGVGLLVAVLAAVALLSPSIGRGSEWFVDRMVLQRPDYDALKASILRVVQLQDNVPELFASICERLRPAVSASSVRWSVWVPPPDDAGAGRFGPVVLTDRSQPVPPADGDVVPADNVGVQVLHPGRGEVAIMLVRSNEPPHHVIRIGSLTGGRRLLSDDLAFLDGVATIVARRVDAIRMTSERYVREAREQEMARLTTEAELRALRAQINPHFLFNTLTTIAHLIQVSPVRALHTLMRLTSLLRAALRWEGASTTLGRELELVEWYLEIEAARFEERLRVTIDVPDSVRQIPVPPFVLQPLVENAIKHGIAHKPEGGDVIVRASLQAAGNEESRLLLTVEDTGIGGAASAFVRGRHQGVGLDNLERRLDCLYGAAASLNVQSAVDTGTTVRVLLPTTMPTALGQRRDEVVT